MANIKRANSPLTSLMKVKMMRSNRQILRIVHKTLYILVSFALVASVFVINSSNVQAALVNVTVSNASLQITDSRPSTASTYLYTYTASDTTDTVGKIVINFCQAATGACVLPTAMTLAATPTVTVKFNGTSQTNTASWSSPVLTITITTPAAAVNPVTVSVPVTGNSNSVATVYSSVSDQNSAQTSTWDAGEFATAIVSGVTVSTSVDQILTFTVTGISSGTAVGTGADIAESAGAGQSATANSLAFGDLTSSPTTTNLLQQEISIATNGTGGYSVYLYENTNMTNDSGTTVQDGPGGVSNATWTNNSTTGFAVNVTNAATSCAAGNFVPNAANFATNAKYNAIPHTPTFPANGITLGGVASGNGSVAAGDNACVNYKLAMPTNQPAGYYNNTIEYIVVPKY